MTPTLLGRIETRLFLLATVGLVWTLVVSPFLPRPGWASLNMVYHITLKALVLVAVVGIGWEFLYHGLQQFRWNKDWPSLFGLLNGVNEGILIWVILVASGTIPIDVYGVSNPIFPLFLLHFTSTWVLVWLVSQSLIRVLFIRWRFQGGRIV